MVWAGAVTREDDAVVLGLFGKGLKTAGRIGLGAFAEQNSDTVAQTVGSEPVVGGKEAEEVPVGLRERKIVRSVLVAMRKLEHPHPRILLLEGSTDRHGPIRGSVADDYQLEVSVGLFDDAGDGFGDETLAIVDGEEHRHFWLAVHHAG